MKGARCWAVRRDNATPWPEGQGRTECSAHAGLGCGSRFLCVSSQALVWRPLPHGQRVTLPRARLPHGSEAHTSVPGPSSQGPTASQGRSPVVTAPHGVAARVPGARPYLPTWRARWAAAEPPPTRWSPARTSAPACSEPSSSSFSGFPSNWNLASAEGSVSWR